MSIKNNNIKNLLIIFISLFILIFFTKGAIYNLTELKDLEIQKNDKLSNIVKELDNLQKLEQELKIGNKKDEINSFLLKPEKADIIEFLHDYAEDVSNSGNELFIHSITFSKEKKGELGFREQDIMLKVLVGNKNVLKALLVKLTTSKYKFFISNFSFQNDNRSGSYTVTIPLKLLYK